MLLSKYVNEIRIFFFNLSLSFPANFFPTTAILTGHLFGFIDTIDGSGGTRTESRVASILLESIKSIKKFN